MYQFIYFCFFLPLSNFIQLCLKNSGFCFRNTFQNLSSPLHLQLSSLKLNYSQICPDYFIFCFLFFVFYFLFYFILDVVLFYSKILRQKFLKNSEKSNIFRAEKLQEILRVRLIDKIMGSKIMMVY